jgi:coenzyme F420-reducing hydrogenase beta subunit
MDFLRSCEKALKSTAKEYLEYNVVGVVRADIDDGTVFVQMPDDIVKEWNLNPLFKAILNDPY